MNVEMVARSIQLILAPVVMVTACAVLLQGLVSRYTALHDRLRALSRERLDLHYAGPDHQPDRRTERLREIDHQIPDLLHRHRLIQYSVLSVYCSVMIFIFSMFVIALAAATDSAWAATSALLVFLAGTGVLFLGILLTAIEVRNSHRSVRYEAARVSELMTSLAQQEAEGDQESGIGARGQGSGTTC
jgi:hypothetical protein